MTGLMSLAVPERVCFIPSLLVAPLHPDKRWTLAGWEEFGSLAGGRAADNPDRQQAAGRSIHVQSI